MSVPTFKDLGKPASDVLNESFPTDLTFKIENLGDASSSFTVQVAQKAQKEGGDEKKKSPYSASLKSKLAPRAGVTAEITAFSEDKLKVDLAAADLFTKGLKFKFGEEYNTQTGAATASPSVEFKNAQVNTTVGVDVPFNLTQEKDKVGTAKFNGSLVAKVTDAAFVGGNVSLAGQTIEGYAVKGQYSLGSVAVVAGLESKKDQKTKSLSVYSPLNLGSTPSKVAVQLNHGKEFGFLVGLESSLNTSATLKAKFDLSGKVSTAVTHQITPFAKLNAAAAFDLHSTSPASVGVTVTLADK
eukprot:TRINITY_DN137_c0_g1_i3.p1 TRINITY_DN137_c0_g1~~TRINITY_DN137_c0_g1_i3.p1  ORF type:complete len:299 (-),score=134.92 TRINITY_DN137_c0_g1_i3:311-1207(-)